jgi:hypothetical protein
MKTLVIHPNDYSTYFLRAIYNNKPYSIIQNNVSNARIRREIMLHDRIILLGHGTEQGLIGFNRFIINSKTVQALRKKEVIAIWCHANKFVEKYKLKSPLYSGMVISEEEEALSLTMPTDSLSKSNIELAHALRKAISSENMLKTFKESFNNFPNQIICSFNKDNFYETK